MDVWLSLWRGAVGRPAQADASAMVVWLSLWRGAVGRPAPADASAMVVRLSLWRGAVGRPAPADASAMVVRLSLWLALILSLTCGASAFAAGGAKANKSAQPRRGATKTTTSKATVKSAAPKTAAPKTAAAKAAATVIPATVAEPPQAGTKAYKLRYKFKPGETVRWEVEHRAKVRTTVSAPAPSGAPPADVVASSTQTAETLSTSIKVWKVISVDEKANTTLVYSVERVVMVQKFDGRQETHYNSETDDKPPPGYDKVAEAVGKPLAELTLDPLGTVVQREERYVQAAPLQENITLPLPENAVAVGEEWTMPADITVTLPQGATRKIKARQVYRLETVDDGVATVHLETQVLTPVNDPAVESQLVQSKANGTVRFDIAAGRILSQQSDIDEHVNGFQGPASNLHYVTRFSEKLLPDADREALQPQPLKKR